MSTYESILTGAGLMLFVFVVLALLWGLVRLMSLVLVPLSQKLSAQKPVIAVTMDEQPELVLFQPDGTETYTGELRLTDVDEPTAAMIMAIVSDESGIPLSDLCFRSIRRM